MESNKEEKNYAPAITSTEIAEWENRFKEIVSPLVEFEKQDNGQSMKLYSGLSGTEASWKGAILLSSDNYINWDFSLQNGPFIEAKYKLDSDNHQIIENIYNFYQQWRSEWSKMLTMPPTPEIDASHEKNIQEIQKRTKQNIIDNHSERMKRLAGLY